MRVKHPGPLQELEFIGPLFLGGTSALSFSPFLWVVLIFRVVFIIWGHLHIFGSSSCMKSSSFNFWLCPHFWGCLQKLSTFSFSESYYTKKWDRILIVVYWCHQMNLRRQSSIQCCLPSKVLYIKGNLLSYMSFIKSHIPSKVILHWRPIEVCLPLHVVFYWSLYSIDSCLPLKVVFHERLSSI